jgi:hypothetical protein
MQTLGAELGLLASWWRQEMREVIADLQQRLAPNRPQRTTIALTASGGIITQHWRNGESKSAQFHRAQTGELPPDPGEFWPTGAPRETTVHLLLPPNAILVHHIWLPAGAEKNLTPVIELQLERDLPMPRDQVQLDWRVEARNRDRAKIKVAVAIVWRGEIERLLADFSRWPVRVVSIIAEPPGTGLTFNFSPRRRRRSTGRLPMFDRALLIGAPMFTLVFTIIVCAQWVHERRVVDEMVLNMREPTRRIERMRSDLDKVREPVLTLHRLMASPSAARILLDLTSAIPHESWIQQLEISRCESDRCFIKLTALTPAATTLADQLARSPHFEKVELQTAASLALGAARDRAELSMVWRQPHVEGDAS